MPMDAVCARAWLEIERDRESARTATVPRKRPGTRKKPFGMGTSGRTRSCGALCGAQFTPKAFRLSSPYLLWCGSRPAVPLPAMELDCVPLPERVECADAV